MNKKALFLDLDGTLLNDRREITDGNRSAICQALEMGHKIIINTGRPLVSALKQAEILGLTSEGCYLIAYNGGILYDIAEHRVISRSTLPLHLVRAVFAEANRRGIHVQTYSETEVLVEPRCDDEGVRRYCDKILMTYRVIPDVRELQEEPVKVLYLDYYDQEPLREFKKWIDAQFGDSLDTFFSCKEYVEVVPKGLNKGNALLEMASLLGIPVEHTVAAGDEANDEMMIRAAGVGVCMRNGTEALKAIADYVTERDNNQDGIREIIEKFLL